MQTKKTRFTPICKPFGRRYGPQRPVRNYKPLPYRADYRDLRDLQDDTILLNNPDKGWYIHYVDNGVRQDGATYRADIKGPESLENIPQLNGIYLRMDWSDIEKEKGVFDFSFIDDVFERFGREGYIFNFRLCTFEGSADCAYATPKFVFDEGAKGIPVGEDMEPVYDDPIFLTYLDKFLAKFAERYDGHPMVRSIDIGTFGTWGEGHTWGGSRTVYPYETFKKHIDLHVRHFKKTRIVINYGFMQGALNSDEQNAEMIEYCRSLGMGIRNDSICVSSYSAWYQYDTLYSRDLFQMFAETAPVDLEFAHYYHYSKAGRFREGLPMIEACRNAQATYAGFHGFVTKWYKKHKYLHEYLGNRLGYWYFVRGYTLPALPAGGRGELKLEMENRGYARAYNNYNMRVMLQGDCGCYTVYDGAADNTDWLQDKLSTATYTLDLSGVPAGQYRLKIGMRSKDNTVYLAMKTDRLDDDGMYTIGDAVVE